MALATHDMIENIVLGASLIRSFYHAILFIHQKDKFLLLYANYLFSLSVYLIFRRITHYDSFEVSTNRLAFAFDYPLILYMLVSYVVFCSIILKINDNAPIVKLAVYLFYFIASILLIIHGYKLIFTNECYLTREFFVVSKLFLSGCAFLGILGAWKVRDTFFIRTIMAGAFAYATCSLLTIISVYFNMPILGLFQYDLYFIGCLIDILIFSSALGYRNYLNQQASIEAHELLVAESKKNSALIQLQHDVLQKENEQHQRQLAIQETLQAEVGASLSSIHIFAELVLQRDDSSKESLGFIQQIATQTQELMDNIGDIIWLANLDANHLHEAFIIRVKNYGQEIIQSQNKVCTYQVNSYFREAQLTKNLIKDSLLEIKQTMRKLAQDDHATIMDIVFDCDKSKPKILIF